MSETPEVDRKTVTTLTVTLLAGVVYIQKNIGPQWR